MDFHSISMVAVLYMSAARSFDNVVKRTTYVYTDHTGATLVGREISNTALSGLLNVQRFVCDTW